MLFLFEYRAATLLIRDQFPGSAAAAISKFEIDDDVISLDGRQDPLRTESETDENGRIIRVRIRRSTADHSSAAVSSLSSMGITPRASNLSSAEVFSVNTPPAVVVSSHNPSYLDDVVLGYRSGSPHVSGYASSDAYSLQPTPRASNFNELDTVTTATTTPTWALSPVAGKVFRQSPPAFPGVMMTWQSSPRGVGGKDVNNNNNNVPGVYKYFYILACVSSFDVVVLWFERDNTVSFSELRGQTCMGYVRFWFVWSWHEICLSESDITLCLSVNRKTIQQ